MAPDTLAHEITLVPDLRCEPGSVHLCPLLWRSRPKLLDLSAEAATVGSFSSGPFSPQSFSGPPPRWFNLGRLLDPVVGVAGRVEWSDVRLHHLFSCGYRVYSCDSESLFGLEGFQLIVNLTPGRA